MRGSHGRSKRVWTRVLIAAGLLALVASCGGDASDSRRDVSLTLDIPKGALPEGTTRDDLTIRAEDPEAIGDLLPLAAFDLGPDGIEFDVPIIATVSAPFESGAFIAAFSVSDGRDPERLELLSHDIDEETAAIVARFAIPHFSRLVLGVEHATLELVEPGDASIEFFRGVTTVALKIDIGAHALGEQIPIRFRVTEPLFGDDPVFSSDWFGGGRQFDAVEPGALADAIFRGLGGVEDASDANESGRSTGVSPVRVLEGVGSPGPVEDDGTRGDGLDFGTDTVPIPPSADPLRPGSAEFVRVLQCTSAGTFSMVVMVKVESSGKFRTLLMAWVTGSCTESAAGDDDPVSATPPRPVGVTGGASLTTSGEDSCGNLEALAEGFFVNAGPSSTGGILRFGGTAPPWLRGILRPDGAGGGDWEHAPYHASGGPDYQQLTGITIEPGLISAVLDYHDNDGCEVETFIEIDVDEAVTEWFQALPAPAPSDCMLAEGATLDTTGETMTLRAVLLDRDTGAPAPGQRLVVEVISEDGERVAYDAVSGADGSVLVEMVRPEGDGSSTAVMILKGAHVLETMFP